MFKQFDQPAISRKPGFGQLLVLGPLANLGDKNIDLQAGALIQNYTGTLTPILLFRNLLTSGFSGNWNRPGINNSTAAFSHSMRTAAGYG